MYKWVQVNEWIVSILISWLWYYTIVLQNVTTGGTGQGIQGIKSTIIQKCQFKKGKKLNCILNFKKKIQSYTKDFPKFPSRMAKYLGAYRSEPHFSRK